MSQANDAWQGAMARLWHIEPASRNLHRLAAKAWRIRQRQTR